MRSWARIVLEEEWISLGGENKLDVEVDPALAERHLIAEQMLDRLDLVEEYVEVLLKERRK